MHGGNEYAYGMWVVAAFNVGLFLFFMLSFLKPRGSDEWRAEAEFGETYNDYIRKTPAFFPSFDQWKVESFFNGKDSE